MGDTSPALTTDLIQRRNEEGGSTAIPIVRSGFLAENDVDLETMVCGLHLYEP